MSRTCGKRLDTEVELKPYVGQVFPSYNEALAFYREYARNSGFEIRKATTEQSKKGDGYSHRYFMIFVPFSGIDNHKKCVTFAVGLLASESIESYKWLLMAFKSTFGQEPTVLMTDQYPTIKQAVPTVFLPSCRHRLCMWHISQKFTDKLGSHMSKTGLLKRLNNLIWNERISASEFDIEWQSIMDEYDLNNNNWFNKMFAIRDKWIPAYFQDCHLSGLMQTTSRPEGENYFYELMTNADLHLIEFVSHFETAMEAQRFVQRKNNHESRYTNPEIITKLLIEEEAAQTFTQTVFFEVQTEIMASMLTWYSIKVVEYDGITKFSIKDTDKDVKHFGDFEVSFMKSDCTKVKELTKNVEEETRNARPMTNTAFIGSVLGVEKRDKVTVKIPEGIRNKGSGPIKKRMIGQKETVIVNAKKGSRKCGRCGKYVDHNTRTCQQKANVSTSK
uniref:MULE transposase domain-containing protein n=1 Tax=Lactuca sativa TaxID=4236 RepID=A0A9R1UM69_LACSA|nr:hypothetical protein LSAT_V11C800440060 [Lactuca sativa]